MNVAPTHVEINSLPPLSNEEIAYRKEKRSHERKRFTVEKWTLLVLGLYTGIAGVQACLTRRAIRNSENSFRQTLCQMQAQTAAQQRTAQAAAESAENAKNTFLAQEMPVVSMQGVFVNENVDSANGIQVRVIFGSTGIARNVRGGVKLAVGNDACSRNWDYTIPNSDVQNLAVLYPMYVRELYSRVYRFPVDLLVKWKQKETKACVYGFVNYQDRLDNWYCSDICEMAIPRSGNMTAGFNPCPFFGAPPKSGKCPNQPE